MVLTKDFGPMDIFKQVEQTGIKGRHFTFIDDLSPDELENVFKTAMMMEPFWRSRIPLLEGKVLCTQFFQPSTRTRFSMETAMYRLGGNVITESNPLVSSSAAKGGPCMIHSGSPPRLPTLSFYATQTRRLSTSLKSWVMILHLLSAVGMAMSLIQRRGCSTCTRPIGH